MFPLSLRVIDKSEEESVKNRCKDLYHSFHVYGGRDMTNFFLFTKSHFCLKSGFVFLIPFLVCNIIFLLYNPHFLLYKSQFFHIQSPNFLHDLLFLSRTCLFRSRPRTDKVIILFFFWPCRYNDLRSRYNESIQSIHTGSVSVRTNSVQPMRTI